MNTQIRKLFVIALALFAVLAVALTLVQFVFTSDLVNNQRNARRYLQAAERDRGPIIVADTPIALSERQDGLNTYQRVYPDGPLYAAVTGYFSASNLTATGMEAAENDVLEGNTPSLLWQRLRNLFAGKPREGGGVSLTIDPEMQQAAADLLGNRSGAVVALETDTGAILTLYSSPSFDPNPLASLDSAVALEATQELESDPRRPLDNRAIASNRYAPGSTFKILTAAALLESGVSPGTKLDAPTTTVLPGTQTEISNVDGNECGTGEVSLTEAFARSCNTAFVIASERLEPDSLSEISSRFLFGEPLNVPLVVTPSTFPVDTDRAQLAMSAIGQFEVQTTPMQMAMVAATVANGGTMMHPYLVDSVLDADNQKRSSTSPQVLAQPIRTEIAHEITEMMIAAVNEPYGTARAASLGNMQVAAKTGTAEVGVDGHTNAWTVAFAPADNPKIAIAVIVEGSADDPHPHGGDVAAPIVARLMEVGLK